MSVFRGPVRNSGDFLKRLAVVLLVIGILGSVITFIVMLSSAYNLYYSERQTAIGMAWIVGGVSLVVAFLGSVILYVMGDMADNLWIIAHRSKNDIVGKK